MGRSNDAETTHATETENDEGTQPIVKEENEFDDTQKIPKLKDYSPKKSMNEAKSPIGVGDNTTLPTRTTADAAGRNTMETEVDIEVVDIPPKPTPAVVDLTNIAEEKTSHEKGDSDSISRSGTIREEPMKVVVELTDSPYASQNVSPMESDSETELDFTHGTANLVKHVQASCLEELEKFYERKNRNTSRPPSSMAQVFSILAQELPSTYYYLDKIPGFKDGWQLQSGLRDGFLKITKKFGKQKFDIYRAAVKPSTLAYVRSRRRGRKGRNRCETTETAIPPPTPTPLATHDGNFLLGHVHPSDKDVDSDDSSATIKRDASPPAKRTRPTRRLNMDA